MATDIKVPTLGESVSEATIAQWFKKPGDAVAQDEPLVELETDKVTVEVPAPAAGTLGEIRVQNGETVEVGAVLGSIEEGAGAGAASPAAPNAQPAPQAQPSQAAQSGNAAAPGGNGGAQPLLRQAREQDLGGRPAAPESIGASRQYAASTPGAGMPPAPSARKLMAESGLGADQVEGSGRRGQVLKEDVLRALERPAAQPQAQPQPQPAQARAPSSGPDTAREERVRMTRLRQTIARRLKDAQNTAAMLTTFNDVDMKAVMDLRREYKDLFEKKHGQKLGFMGFFVKAIVQALKEIPAVNAEIDGTDLVYKNYYHIGVAVGTERGLVVPVLRDADQMSLAEIEKTIGDFGRKARDGQLSIEDMQGGTFTVSNGGVYGSLMSTPILNAPQSGILGMHRIEERPVVHKGQIVARPMMYLALSYDHRIVDGKEAVTFLVRIKESIEDPQRLVLDL
jgi:2-oxoglutarate dehydrogenase E2 component (dihydrolipoamide succinyltransferase)